VYLKVVVSYALIWSGFGWAMGNRVEVEHLETSVALHSAVDVP